MFNSWTKTMNTKDIKVSVVIPMYNSALTILETLDSVCKQSCNDWEVICIDDCSTDNTYEVVEAYSKKECRVSVFQRTSCHKGGSVCRNEGAKHARGEFLIFLDADDLLAPSCIENRLRSIEDTNIDFVVYPMAYFLGSIDDAKVYSNLNAKNELFCFASGAPTWQVTSPIIRKSFFDSLGGFDESFQRYQDVEFHVRAIMMSGTNYVIKRQSAPDCYYRTSGAFNSFTSNKLLNNIKACPQLLHLFRSYNGRISNKKAYTLTIVSIYMNYLLFCYRLNNIDPAFIWNYDSMPISALQQELPSCTISFLRFIEALPNNSFNTFILRVLRKIIYIIISKGLI